MRGYDENDEITDDYEDAAPIDSDDAYDMGLRPARCNGCELAKLKWELGDKFLMLDDGIYELDAHFAPGQAEPLEYEGRPIRFHEHMFMSYEHSDECYHWKPPVVTNKENKMYENVLEETVVTDVINERSLVPVDKDTEYQLQPTTSLVPDVKPSEVIVRAQEQAKALMDIVEQQRLYAVISGKKYLQVEAWQLLAAFNGLNIVIESTERVYDESEVDTLEVDTLEEQEFLTSPQYEKLKEEGRSDLIEITKLLLARRRVSKGPHIGWQSKAKIYNAEGRVVGAGEAQCTNNESKVTWRKADDYARRSMAQTRAVSKACRTILSFVVVLAGYEPTPFEEMDGVVSKSLVTNEQLDVINSLSTSKTIEWIKRTFDITALAQLTQEQASSLITRLKKAKET